MERDIRPQSVPVQGMYVYLLLMFIINIYMEQILSLLCRDLSLNSIVNISDSAFQGFIELNYV